MGTVYFNQKANSVFNLRIYNLLWKKKMLYY